ncbi:hypothetical protein B0J13DRAFT_530678 [Dactylonectria estremocensis]|uniref:Uncharacterized protein n=1 Tax=Dactylonectria estremocensis TaxID=1079267 RepID=A0A9P9IQY8_9HYPO|nr:hypothetical protein B0J13DRAFT_530678 [Dactylonectria estremocensis]
MFLLSLTDRTRSITVFMVSETVSKQRNHADYTIGWICALPKEQTAAMAMLDERDLPRPPKDPITYTLGSVGKHNVVIACLPKGQMGNNLAATLGAWVVSTFPSLKFGLLVVRRVIRRDSRR